MRKKDVINNVKTKKIGFSLFLIEVELLYNVVLISALQRSESAIHRHISPPSRLFFQSFGSPSGVSLMAQMVKNLPVMWETQIHTSPPSRLFF